MKARSLVHAFACIAACVVIHANAGAQTSAWVEVERRETLTAGRSADDVKRDALHAALADAVRRVSGVRVTGAELSVRAESAGRVIDRYSEIVSIAAEGRVTDWIITRATWTGGTSAPVYHLQARVKVEREQGHADPAFRASIEVNAPRLQVRSSDVRENDELIARVTSSRDGFVSLFLISGDSVTVLTPNVIQQAEPIAAGSTTELPPRDLRESGLRFRAALPPGTTGRIEVVFAVVTRGPASMGAVTTVFDLNRWLASIPASERALAQATVEVRRIR